MYVLCLSTLCALQVSRSPTVDSLPLVKVGSVQLYVNPSVRAFATPESTPSWMVSEITGSLSKDHSKIALLSPTTVTVKHTFVYNHYAEAACL